MIKYRDLSADQRNRILGSGLLNGCGPDTWKCTFDWWFKADCLEHDYNYLVGGSEADRRWADWGFYQAMVKDTHRLSYFAQPWARMQAYLFYKLTLRAGKKHFNKCPDPRLLELL